MTARGEGAPTNARPADIIDLPELARTFGRYKWGILALVILATAISALIAFSLPPKYKGTVSLLIESQGQRVAQITDVYSNATPEIQFLYSQMAVLRSRDIARQVVERLDLRSRPEFRPDPEAWDFSLSSVLKHIPFLPADLLESEPETEEQKTAALINQVMEDTKVEVVSYSQVITVAYEAASPALAAEVANTIADLYIESGLQARLDATTKATSWLTDKLAEIQKQLSAAEKALQQFREKENLVNVGGTRGLTEDEVLDYSRRLREAQRERSELQNTYENIRAAGNDARRLRDVSALLNDPTVQQVNSRFLEAREAVRQVQERYGSKHPSMVTAQARLDNAANALDEQLRIAAAGIRTRYEISRASESDLSQRLNTAKANVQRLDRKDYELSVLEREVTTYRELYDTFLTRFRETDVASTFQNVSARVIDPAVESRDPSRPNKKKIVLLTAIGALLAGIMLAALHHLLSEGITSAEELEAVSQLPLYGVLPLVRGFAARKNNVIKYLTTHGRTPFAEGIRSACAALRLSGGHKRIMVTSSVPAEGKSSICGSIAMTLGASEKVVLVETDLRKPVMRRYFSLPSHSKGVADVVAGNITLDDALQYSQAGNIWILPAGSNVANPADLLVNPRFAAILEQLSERFDRVVLDSPPCQAASDALMLGRHADGVLFVVKSDATSRRAVKNSLKQLRNAGVTLLGAVINQVDTRRNPHYADTYYYAYGYYG